MVKGWIKSKKEQQSNTAKDIETALNGCVKFSSKKYICYDRKWLYDHLDEEFDLLKRCKDMQPISQKEIREFMEQVEEIKNNG